jgi:hypothetical protein
MNLFSSMKPHVWKLLLFFCALSVNFAFPQDSETQKKINELIQLTEKCQGGADRDTLIQKWQSLKQTISDKNLAFHCDYWIGQTIVRRDHKLDKGYDPSKPLNEHYARMTEEYPDRRLDARMVTIRLNTFAYASPQPAPGAREYVESLLSKDLAAVQFPEDSGVSRNRLTALATVMLNNIEQQKALESGKTELDGRKKLAERLRELNAPPEAQKLSEDLNRAAIENRHKELARDAQLDPPPSAPRTTLEPVIAESEINKATPPPVEKVSVSGDNSRSADTHMATNSIPLWLLGSFAVLAMVVISGLFIRRSRGTA